MSVVSKLRAFRRPKQIELEDYLEKIRKAGLNDEGQLVPDPRPIAPPVGYKRQPSLAQLIREMVASESLAKAARESGHETFEESEDFDVDDEPELLRSQWENEFDPPLSELQAAGQAELDKKMALQPPSDGPGTPVPPRSGGDAGPLKGPPEAPKAE